MIPPCLVVAPILTALAPFHAAARPLARISRLSHASASVGEYPIAPQGRAWRMLPEPLRRLMSCAVLPVPVSNAAEPRIPQLNWVKKGAGAPEVLHSRQATETL